MKNNQNEIFNKPILKTGINDGYEIKMLIQAIREILEKKYNNPKAFVETYGCQQNESDSERIRGMLLSVGYGFTDSVKEADLVIYNTCAVRENAELRVFGNIGALKHEKRKRPDMIIGVCGCMMQQEHIQKIIRSKYKHVDLLFGTHALYRFLELLYRALLGERVFDAKDEKGEIHEGTPVFRDNSPVAKIPVMYGCNNFCTYCIVPYVRGRERSRSKNDIISECEKAAKQGFKEVMLLGQNVNSYGNDLKNGYKFYELLNDVSKIDGIERIRFMTSHPKDLSDELIHTIKTNKKVCYQLHLPIQSGSSRILKLMNRKYTKEQYMEKLLKVKKEIPDIVITTDVIVGFPGETNEDFNMTLEALKEAEFDMIFSFIYSKRRGTPAAEMTDCLTDEEKHINFNKMLKLQNEISKKKNLAYLDKTLLVLVEGTSKTNDMTLSGRTEGGKVVDFEYDSEKYSKEDLFGNFAEVKITGAKTWSLFGKMIEK